MFLPELAYCDRAKVISLLSVLVNEIVPEYSLTLKQNISNKGNIETSFNSSLSRIAAKYSREDSKVVEKSGIVKVPTESLFSDLHQILTVKEKIQRLIGFDDEIIKQLSVGEFIEIDGTIQYSPVEIAITSLVDVMEKFKGIFNGSEAEIYVFSQIFRSPKSTLILEHYSDSNVKILTTINGKTENLYCDKYELEGEYTLFGRIKKIYPSSKKIDLLKLLPGKLKFKEKDMKEMFEKLNDFADSPVEFRGIERFNEDMLYLEGPIIEIAPIAIYQNF